jgi:Ca2+-binding EF-hand superfamily protein
MKTIPVSSLVAGMLFPAVCHAQPDRPGDNRGAGRTPSGPHPAKGFSEAWNQADLNHDGRMSREEFKAMSRVRMLPEEKQDKIFDRLDKDGDGVVSHEEISRFGHPHDGKALRRLWELDVDKSGGISLDEFSEGQLFKKLPPPRMEELFRRLDTDGDGLITPKDKPEPPEKRTSKGGNPKKGGKKGPKEGGSEGRLDRMIVTLDTNGDGWLSFSEFRQGGGIKDLTEDEQEDRFEKLDRNHDQRLAPEDAMPPPPKKKD